MAKTERGLIDEAAARLRGLLKDLERLIQPPRPAPVPVPVPVRPNPERRPRPDDPWRR